MFIQTEQTPNPDTLKFLPGQPVMVRGTAEFRSPGQAARSPLAQRILSIPGVAGVFLGSDFISVTREPGTEWSFLRTLVLGEIMQHFVSGLPVIELGGADDGTEDAAPHERDEITLQIIELLDTRVRPAVAADGGDINFVRFDDGIVYLRMKGACSGCPSATVTLKNGIESMLRHYVPEVVEVRAVEEGLL